MKLRGRCDNIYHRVNSLARSMPRNKNKIVLKYEWQVEDGKQVTYGADCAKHTSTQNQKKMMAFMKMT
jgi:hypothetical protein